jgi:hypothetical protein
MPQNLFELVAKIYQAVQYGWLDALHCWLAVGSPKCPRSVIEILRHPDRIDLNTFLRSEAEAAKVARQSRSGTESANGTVPDVDPYNSSSV